MSHRDWKGLTPMAFAVVRLRRDFIDLLLEYNAPPFARPSHQDTIIHLAVLEEESSALEMVLEVPQFCTPEVLNAKNSRGVTALHLCACNTGQYGRIHSLVDAGAEVNILSDSGFSALDLAYILKKFISSNLISLASDNFYTNKDEGSDDGMEVGKGDPKHLPLDDVKRWAEILKDSDAKSGPFELTEGRSESKEYEGAHDHSKRGSTKPQYDYTKLDLKSEEQACLQVVSLLIASGAKRYRDDDAMEGFLFME